MNYYLTSAEKLIIERTRLEGKLEGWQEGWTSGWNEGVKTTQHGLLALLVNYKYGPNSATCYAEQIKAATAIEVQSLCKKLITCPNIEALFSTNT